MTLTISFSNKIYFLGISRSIFGIFESFMQPVNYSLIVDYWPQNKRGTVNSVYSLGAAFGISLSYLSVLLLEYVGWRWTFAATASFGFFVGLMILIFIKEPPRGRYDVKKIKKP